MEFFANNIILIMFFPLWVSLIILAQVIFKMSGNKKITVFLTLLSTLIGLIFSLEIFNYVRIPNTLILEKNILWIPFENFNFYTGTLIDETSTSFLVILMFVSFLVQLYCYGYMKNKENFSLYYIFLNLFNFSMTGLILSPNLFQMYIFWELVGVMSYLLIGFYYKKEDVSNAAKRVFIINRIGDFAFMLSIILLIYISFSYINQPATDILNFSDINSISNKLLSVSYPLLFDIISLLLIFSGFVKSAQFPMHLWLTDAMKAPAPVSALIHSATMVCMGIFLIIRIYPILKPEMLNIILITGLITSLICAFIATTQNNIKKMLAYSTCSQLGLIFTALGLFSIPAAIIYLVIHSFTKALLFLTAGTIEIKYNGSNNMLEMGGLRKNDFYQAIYWLIGSISLSGLFLGGFTSKEILLNAIYKANLPAVLFLVLLTSYLTTFYIFRAYFMIFEKNNSSDMKILNPYYDKSMTVSLTILCIFIVIPGFIFKLENINLICLIMLAIGILAIINAYASFKSKKIFMPKSLYNLSYNELYMPQLYNFMQNIFSKIFKLISNTEFLLFDKVNSIIPKILKFLSGIISKLQNGNIQSYISYSIFSISIILTFIVLLLYIARGV